MRKRFQQGVPYAAAALGLIVAAILSGSLEKEIVKRTDLPANSPLECLTKGSLAYARDVTVTFLWIRTVQWVGDIERTRDQNYEDLAFIADVITYLDPHFLPAYKTVALVFYEYGVKYNLESFITRAEALIDIGIKRNPRAKFLWFYKKGAVLVFKRRYAESIPFLKAAIEQDPDHPVELDRFLAFAYERIGDWWSAAVLWEQMMKTSVPDTKAHKIAVRRYREALEHIRKHHHPGGPASPPGH